MVIAAIFTRVKRWKLCNEHRNKTQYMCVCAKSLQSGLTLQPYVLYVACQAPLSMGFSRQKYWSGLPCPPPGNLSDSGTELESLNVSCIDWQVLYH